MKKDTVQTIFRSARGFFSGTMLSRISGMVRDIVIAFTFGTQDALAAFFVAFRLSHLFRRLLGEGALQTAFIPHFEELRKNDPEKAYSFFRNLIKSLTLILFLLISLVITICYYFYDGSQQILLLTMLMIPSLMFVCLYGLNTAFLQCEKHYFLPAVSPVAFNCMWIFGIIAVGKWPLDQAMVGLSVFIVLASAIQWLITLVPTYQLLKKCTNHHETNELWNIIKPYFLAIIGVSASQINSAMDVVFARYADLQGPAYLWYSIRIQQLPIALIAIAISSATLPPLTRAFKNHDFGSYKKFLQTGLIGVIGFLVPITAALFLIGDSCINLIYGRGSFTDHSVVETTYCLWGYTLGLVPMGIILILAPGFYAQKNYFVPTVSSIISLIFNLFLNSLMVIFLGFGAASVAFTTSVCAWINCGILCYALKRKNIDVFDRSIQTFSFRVLATTSLAIFILAMYETNFYKLLRGVQPYYFNIFNKQLSHFIIQFALFSTPLLVLFRNLFSPYCTRID